jgi:hypothetical protein
MPVIIDPGLYKKTKGDLFWVSEKRELPTAFKLFTGMDALLSVLIHVFFTGSRRSGSFRTRIVLADLRFQ